MWIILSCCIITVMAVAVSADPLFTTTNMPPPRLRLEFDTHPNSNSEVHKFFVEFARAEGFKVADGTPKMPLKGGHPVFNLELRRGNTATVNVTNIVRSDQYLVFAYEPKPSAAFAGIASRLTNRLKEKWPNTEPYRDQ
jgi:hypothetical protein